MSSKKIYILGSGGMAREVYTIYSDAGTSDVIAGFVIGKGYKKKSDTLYEKKVFNEEELDNSFNDSYLIGAIGNPMRRFWIKSLEEKGGKFDTIVHPKSKLGQGIEIGYGCIVCYGAVLTCDISIGKHSIININALIHHDCKIGNFATISPGVNIAGNVTIGDNCFIGMGATVIQKVTIGSGVCIGAGAVVTEDIPDNTLVVGVPARIVRKISDEDWEKII